MAALSWSTFDLLRTSSPPQVALRADPAIVCDRLRLGGLVQSTASLRVCPLGVKLITWQALQLCRARVLHV